MPNNSITHRFLLVGALLLGSVALAGCGGARLENETAHVAAAASPQMQCPQQNLIIRAIGNHQFQVQGCGLATTYQCQRGGSRGYGRFRTAYRAGGCNMITPLVRGGY